MEKTAILRAFIPSKVCFDPVLGHYETSSGALVTLGIYDEKPNCDDIKLDDETTHRLAGQARMICIFEVAAGERLCSVSPSGKNHDQAFSQRGVVVDVELPAALAQQFANDPETMIDIDFEILGGGVQTKIIDRKPEDVYVVTAARPRAVRLAQSGRKNCELSVF